MLTIDQFLPTLSEKWSVPVDRLRGYYDELQASRDFLQSLNKAVEGKPEFPDVRFEHVKDLRVFRSLLYLFTRAIGPETFVETGVLNGFGSSFTLLAMHHNKKGTLYSVDMPTGDPRILAQGNRPLPKGQQPGWAIPENLRKRHKLVLGPAQEHLQKVFAQCGRVDAFLHDSDHGYSHMAFELGLAWHYLKPGGWLICDNVEQNASFDDFTRGVGRPGFVIASFDGPERMWKHGLVQKPAEDGKS